MDLMNHSILFAMGSPPTPPGTQPNPTAEMLRMLFMFAILGVMFYFVLLRPQQKRAREQNELLKSVRPGDKIVTSSGIIATVITVKEDSISIRSADAKLEITKGAIAEIKERGDKDKSSDS